MVHDGTHAERNFDLRTLLRRLLLYPLSYGAMMNVLTSRPYPERSD